MFTSNTFEMTLTKIIAATLLAAFLASVLA